MVDRSIMCCPICGDPQPFIFWIDKTVPPTECAYNPAAKSVTDCEHQMTEARRAALWRKVCPASFDAAGVIIPGQLRHVIETVAAAGFDPMKGLPLNA